MLSSTLGVIHEYPDYDPHNGYYQGEPAYSGLGKLLCRKPQTLPPSASIERLVELPRGLRTL